MPGYVRSLLVGFLRGTSWSFPFLAAFAGSPSDLPTSVDDQLLPSLTRFWGTSFTASPVFLVFHRILSLSDKNPPLSTDPSILGAIITWAIPFRKTYDTPEAFYPPEFAVSPTRRISL